MRLENEVITEMHKKELQKMFIRIPQNEKKCITELKKFHTLREWKNIAEIDIWKWNQTEILQVKNSIYLPENTVAGNPYKSSYTLERLCKLQDKSLEITQTQNYWNWKWSSRLMGIIRRHR